MTHTLTPEMVAAELSIPLRTARKWIHSMPGVFRVGKLLRIGRLDFERWITRQKDAKSWERPAPAPRDEVRVRRLIVPRTKPRDDLDISVERTAKKS
jgi:hypothetical protein